MPEITLPSPILLTSDQAIADSTKNMDEIALFSTFPIFLRQTDEQTTLLKSGYNRTISAHCQIQANNDLEAVLCWLHEYKATPDTLRAYEREAQRLLLWCAILAKKPLSDLKRDDFEAYSHFLSNPQPASIWCGPKTQKISANWKPFTGPLSRSSIATAMTILSSLMQYLCDADYFSKNPLRILKKKIVSSFDESEKKLRALHRLPEHDEIQALFTALETLSAKTEKQVFQKRRLHFLIVFLLLTGLRAHEVKINWNQFQLIQGHWWLMVLGKGQKFRSIPINDELLSEIKNYRTFLGKLPYPLPEECSPVITKFQSSENLSTRRINMMINEIASLAAKQFADNPLKADRLRHIGVHGFRHIYSSLQDQANIPRTQIRDNLGHSNISTTEIYLHSNDIKRHNSLQKISVKYNF